MNKKEEEKLLQAIHNNYKKANEKHKREKRIEEMKRQKQEKIKNSLIIISSIALLIGALFGLKKSNDDFMENCLNAGNSQYICEKAL